MPPALSPLTVQATLRYLVPGLHKPVYYASVGGADAQLRISAEFEPQEMTLNDARALSASAKLDIQGFTLVQHRSKLTDFYDNSALPAYEEELQSLLCEHCGAEAVHVFDHTWRADSSALRGDHQSREPASVIHNDYTDASAVQRVRDLLPPRETARRLARRFAIINVWRSIGFPVTTTPLALCDSQSVADEQLIASERHARDRIGELQLVTFDPAHRWYYYPSMKSLEAVLLKTFDSATDGRARRCIHTAFKNPLATAEAPARESIETRCLVFF